jgi:hypothetical protein
VQDEFSVYTAGGEPLVSVRILHDDVVPGDVIRALELRDVVEALPDFLAQLHQDPGLSPDFVAGATWIAAKLQGPS